MLLNGLTSHITCTLVVHMHYFQTTNLNQPKPPNQSRFSNGRSSTTRVRTARQLKSKFIVQRTKFVVLRGDILPVHICLTLSRPKWTTRPTVQKNRLLSTCHWRRISAMNCWKIASPMKTMKGWRIALFSWYWTNTWRSAPESKWRLQSLFKVRFSEDEWKLVLHTPSTLPICHRMGWSYRTESWRILLWNGADCDRAL